MRHLRLLPPADAVDDDIGQPVPELAERLHAARSAGSLEAALHIWGIRVRASRGADVAWTTTRPPWRCPGRLDNWVSPVWLPTAEEERRKPVAPLRLSSLFEMAA
jgi:hypothetical protein